MATKRMVGTSKRLLQLCVLCLFAFTMLGAEDTTNRVEKTGHKLVCQCGCGQILMECNHVGCPVSPVMIDELKTQIAGGASEHTVLNTFIAKYGPIVLAAPMRGGFDNVAWIVPIVAFFGFLAGVFFLMQLWKRRALVATAAIPSPAAAPHPQSIHDRVRSETDYDHWNVSRSTAEDDKR